MEGTVSIPQCNYVPGEQAFMQSPSVPVIGAGKQNLVQAFQTIFAQMKQTENKYAASISLHSFCPTVDMASLSVLKMSRPRQKEKMSE